MARIDNSARSTAASVRFRRRQRRTQHYRQRPLPPPPASASTPSSPPTSPYKAGIKDVTTIGAALGSVLF